MIIAVHQYRQKRCNFKLMKHLQRFKSIDLESTFTEVAINNKKIDDELHIQTIHVTLRIQQSIFSKVCVYFFRKWSLSFTGRLKYRSSWVWLFSNILGFCNIICSSLLILSHCQSFSQCSNISNSCRQNIH